MVSAFQRPACLPRTRRLASATSAFRSFDAGPSERAPRAFLPATPAPAFPPASFAPFTHHLHQNPGDDGPGVLAAA